MRFLVVGGGSREHAIAWRLRASPLITELFIAPGNAGTVQLGQNVPIGAEDIESLLEFARANGVDITVVGPEAPLADGVADLFAEAGMRLFGPTRAAARIESSKSFAKELMTRCGVPTGSAECFDDYETAATYLALAGVRPPFVIKADGLAAGKGVVIAQSCDEAKHALRRSMVEREFGAAGETVLIEEYLEGREVSVFAFVDGGFVSSLTAACDYKRVGDGDVGPNTGGMGSFSPPPFWTPELESRVRREIMEPIAHELHELGSPFRGMLYAGLMLTGDGPKVVEFNCRLGDPEAQAVLPRLKTDLGELIAGAFEGGLETTPLEWSTAACVSVVVASGGYPGAYRTGYRIDGLESLDDEVLVFHAGTKEAQTGEGAIVTDGGRVLTVSALGETMDEARMRAYANVGRVQFDGSFYRSDIAAASDQRAASVTG